MRLLSRADPEELVRVAERHEGLDDECPLEELLPQVLGPADGAQCRVQDGDPVAEPFGFFKPVGGVTQGLIPTTAKRRATASYSSSEIPGLPLTTKLRCRERCTSPHR